MTKPTELDPHIILRAEKFGSIVGVILVYVIDGIAGEVSVDWDLFSEKIQRVPAIATDPAGPFPSFVEPQDPVKILNI